MSAIGMYWAHDAPWLQHLPPGWEVRRFRIATQLTEDRNDDGSDDRLLSLSTTRGVVPKQWDDEGQVRSGDELRKYWRVRPGHVVVNPMWVMNGAVAASEIEGVISPDYRVYQPAPDVSARFLHYLLHSREYMSLYALLTRGSTTFDRRISKVDFHEIPTIVPPLAAQHAIADFLDRKTAAIDALIAKKERLIELLQEKRQALITQSVTKGLDPNVPMKDSGIEWLGEIPAHWEVKRLGYLSHIGNGSTPRRDVEAYWNGGSIPWLNSSAINAGVVTRASSLITERALAECHLPKVPRGAVLVAITGEGQTRGRAALLDIDATINQHLAYIVPHPDLQSEYLRRHLQAMYQWLRHESSGVGSTRAALTCSFLRSTSIVVPPASEQEAIVRTVEENDAYLERLLEKVTSQLAAVREYRQALITEAVTGKLDVTKEDAA